MNLSIIWDKLDIVDRAIIINILKHSHHDHSIDNGFLDNQGKLIFLDAHVVMRELQRYMCEYGRPYDRRYVKIKRIVKMIKDESLPYGHMEE